MASKDQKNPNPKPGDLVEFPRPAGYSHYGVSDGKGSVYHTRSVPEASGTVISKDPLEKVANGRDFKVSNKDDIKTPLPVADILKVAEQRIGEHVNYRPLTCNCETIATQMRYGGEGFTQQGQRIIQGATEAGKSFLGHAIETHDHFSGN